MTVSRSRLGNRLGRLLNDRGWSDGRFAAKVGLSRSRINSIKNRRAAPSVVEALLIARALELRVSEIFQLAPSRSRALSQGASDSVLDGAPRNVSSFTR